MVFVHSRSHSGSTSDGHDSDTGHVRASSSSSKSAYTMHRVLPICALLALSAAVAVVFLRNTWSSLGTRLREEFSVKVPLFYVGDSISHKDGSKVVAYARISHQVYNQLEDYYAFRDVVKMILADDA